MSPLLPGHYYDDEDDNRDEEEAEAQSLLSAGRRKAGRLWDGFMDFALQGNILEIAFGLILAAAFTTLVTSLVSDIILPPISVLLPLHKNMEEKFAVLKAGPHIPSNGYTTLKRAQDDGAVVMAYGIFINKCLNFMGLGLALYGLAGMYQWVSKDDIIKRTVKCRYCRKKVNEKVS